MFTDTYHSDDCISSFQEILDKPLIRQLVTNFIHHWNISIWGHVVK